MTTVYVVYLKREAFVAADSAEQAIARATSEWEMDGLEDYCIAVDSTITDDGRDDVLRITGRDEQLRAEALAHEFEANL